ncbi:unnamed protein product [Parnassius mnemosyne]|uniref:Uncharacterized protein n=1 Tax=Parnassius mnemosyne TaxID=213953 RepID=A0AAV1L8I4_9NEOP
MPKRKRVVLSMRDKYEINKRLEEGETATKLPNEYKVEREEEGEENLIRNYKKIDLKDAFYMVISSRAAWDSLKQNYKKASNIILSIAESAQSESGIEEQNDV